MNRRLAIDNNESNPMLLGCMEIVKEDTQTLMQKQQELNQAMVANPEISSIMEQHKKEAQELQIEQQKKISAMMAENPEIVALMEQHKKEVEDLQNRQRLAVETLMRKDEDIIEAMKQQNEEMRSLSMKQQQALAQEVNNNAAMAGYLNNIQTARQTLQENQQMFEQEMFKAVYMVPAVITPEPVKDEDGNVQVVTGGQIAIQAMQFRNRNLLLAFTDVKEFQKWDKAGTVHTISLGMKELMGAVMKDNNLGGLSINPFSANIVIPRERMEMMIKDAAANPNENSKNMKVVEANINE